MASQPPPWELYRNNGTAAPASGPAPAPAGGTMPGGLSRTPPRLPPPQTAPQAQRDVLGVQETELDIRERQQRMQGLTPPAGYRLNQDASGFEVIPGGPLDPDRAPNRSEAPAGYRYIADGSRLEPIPGGPADTQRLYDPERRRAQVEPVLHQIFRAREGISNWTTGMPGSVLGSRAGTEAYDLRGAITTIQANLAFDRLQQMRDASPTGGALGNVTERELAMLQSTVANLDANQSPEALADSINQVELHYLNYLNSLEGVQPTRDLAEAQRLYRERHPAPGQERPQPQRGGQSGGQAPGGQVETILDPDNNPTRPGDQLILSMDSDGAGGVSPTYGHRELTGEERDAARAYAQGRGEAPPFMAHMTPVQANAYVMNHSSVGGGEYGTGDLLNQGATLQLSDEAAGVGGMIGNVLLSPFTDEELDPLGAYRLERDTDRYRLDQARERTGWWGTAAEVGGGLLSFRPGMGGGGVGPQLPQSLGQRVMSSGKIGGGLGLVGGFGAGEGDFASQATSTAGGGALGFGLGAAMPALGEGGRRGWNALTGARQSTEEAATAAARQTIGRAIEADGNTPGTIARQIEAAQRNGVPMMVGDTGDNVRGVVAASVRAPGPGRTIAREALVERQHGMGERVTGAIERDLGPASNPREVSEQLMTQARTTAAPLYERFYSQPGAPEFAQSVERLLNRPSMRGALARARRIAAEEGRDPDELGLLMNPDGTVSLHGPNASANAAVTAARTRVDEAQQAYRAARSSGGGNVDAARQQLMSARDALTQAQRRLAGAPEPGTAQTTRSLSWQTMDYVKRGMDDVLEARRDPTSGRLNLDEEGRAVNDTLRTFLTRADAANPNWAPARAAWSGPVRANSAMERGLASLNENADEISFATRDMSPNELEMYRLGVRRAIANAISGRTDNANVVATVLGTDKRRQALFRLFGGRQEFDRLVQTLRAEEAGNETFRRATQGSMTAQNAADDAGLSGAVGGGAVDVSIGAPLVTGARMIGRGIGNIRDMTQRQVRERTQQIIASLGTESDPAVLQELARELARLRAVALQRNASATRRTPASGALGGSIGTQVPNALLGN